MLSQQHTEPALAALDINANKESLKTITELG